MSTGILFWDDHDSDEPRETGPEFPKTSQHAEERENVRL